MTQKLDRFLGKCAPCVRPIAVEQPGALGDFLTVSCPECGRRVRLERLYGTQTTMTCDPRCEGAVGSDCECACGGANHGGAFLLEGEALASAVSKYRKQAQVRSEAAKKVADARKAKEEANRRASLSKEERWVLDYEGDSRFLLSLKEQAEKGWSLSDRQVAAIRDNMVRASYGPRDSEPTTGRLSERHPNEQQVPKPRRASEPCPEGENVVIEGKLVKLEEKTYASGPVLQGRVLTEAGWSAWGTIPRALREPEPVEVGRVIRFTATLKAKDETFGFWSYPEGGEVL